MKKRQAPCSCRSETCKVERVCGEWRHDWSSEVAGVRLWFRQIGCFFLVRVSRWQPLEKQPFCVCANVMRSVVFQRHSSIRTPVVRIRFVVHSASDAVHAAIARTDARRIHATSSASPFVWFFVLYGSLVIQRHRRTYERCGFSLFSSRALAHDV